MPTYDRRDTKSLPEPKRDEVGELRFGWSGEHDGCPLHGHATDTLKATAGCTCEEHVNAISNAADVTELRGRVAKEVSGEDGEPA